MKKGPYYRLVRRCETVILRAAIELHEGNRSNAAKALGLERTYFLKLLKSHGLQAEPLPCHVPRCRSGAAGHLGAHKI